MPPWVVASPVRVVAGLPVRVAGRLPTAVAVLVCSAASVADEVATRPALTSGPTAGLALLGCATACV